MDLGADAGDWYRALEAVLGLHTPHVEGETRWCGECAHAWPCATVRGIADAVFADLDGEEATDG